MPSRHRLAVALAALAVLAGCSALPGAGSQGDDTTPVDRSELVLVGHNDGDAFRADVTVTRDGETVFETSVDADGDGTYRNLTSLPGDGPYTVTVNTTVSGASGHRSERFTVERPAGNATVVRVWPLGVDHASVALPREPLDHPLAAYSHRMGHDTDLDVRVWYRGERVAATTTAVPQGELTRVVDLNRTGAYVVAVRGSGDDWTHRPVVVTQSDHHVRVTLDARGRVDAVRVGLAREWA